VGVPGGVVGIEITKNKGVRGVREKFRRKVARSRIVLSVFDGRGVDIEEEKQGKRFWKLILTQR